MNTNFKGMDPELARKAMALISATKASLDAESAAATASLNEKLSDAFSGAQTVAMQGFVDQINGALQNLYKYLDGNDSNFAQKFNEIITSYEVSDANVASTYSGN